MSEESEVPQNTFTGQLQLKKDPNDRFFHIDFNPNLDLIFKSPIESDDLIYKNATILLPILICFSIVLLFILATATMFVPDVEWMADLTSILTYTLISCIISYVVITKFGKYDDKTPWKILKVGVVPGLLLGTSLAISLTH
jgi:hypothetical protein